MTCIAGLVFDETVWIGGDSAGVSGRDITTRADEKVFVNGPCLFGFTSSFRMGQLLRYSFQVPYHDPRYDDYKYLVTTWVDALRSCLKTGGYARTESGEEYAGTFLLGYKGKLYIIDSDYQVGSPHDGYAAVGCGSNLALGSLFSTPDQAPEERLLSALAASEHFNTGVCAPFVVKSLHKDK